MRPTLVAIVLSLAACAGSSTQETTPHQTTTSGAGSGSGMVCHDETPTGSSISRQVCRTPEQSDQDHQRAEDLVRTRGVAPPPPGSIGK